MQVLMIELFNITILIKNATKIQLNGLRSCLSNYTCCDELLYK